MKKFSEMLFASAVVIGLFWLVSADRQADLFTVTIESTELWRNPWPAPGDQPAAGREVSIGSVQRR